MNILIVNNSRIPVMEYGGTERVIWYLGRELAKAGHTITYLVKKDSYCDFGKVLFLDESKPISQQIPSNVDIVHFHFMPEETIGLPNLVTMHGNRNDAQELDINTVFVSRNHAARFGAASFVHNGLDWNDYGPPDLQAPRSYFHFLGNAAWRLKNVKGAIDIIDRTASERIKILGGQRLNLRMGFRFTLSTRAGFYGTVGGEKKNRLLRHSKGLIFPVKWHEPFGLAIIESLYFGCPVFGTPYGSLPELVPGDVGFLSSDSRELVEAVEQAGKYSAKRCHEWAAEHFNSHKMATEYLRKYERILNGYALNTVKPKLIEQQTEKFLPWK